MIDHVWSVVCTRSLTDRETNNVSLLDVLEQINVLGPLPGPGKFALPFSFEVISLWTRSDPSQAEKAPGRLKLVAPNKEEILVQEFPIDLSGNVRMRTQARSAGFPLAGTGRYTFLIEIQRADVWETVARIPLQLETMAQAPMELAAGPGA